MAATYNDPWVSDRDQVRWLLQDTDTAAAINSDTEMDGSFAAWGLREGAAKCADAMALRYSRRVAQFSQSGAEDVTWYRERVTALQAIAQGIRNGTVSVGLPAQVMFGHVTARQTAQTFFQQNGVWPPFGVA